MDYPEYGVAPTTDTMSACEVLIWIGYRRAISMDLYYAPLWTSGMQPWDIPEDFLHVAIPDPKPATCPMPEAQRILMDASRAGPLTVGYTKLDGSTETLTQADTRNLTGMMISARGTLDATEDAGADVCDKAQSLRRAGIHFRTAEIMAEWAPESDKASAPDGYLFIDEAIALVRQRLSCPVTPAVKRLLDSIRHSDISAWERNHAGRRLMAAAEWDDAHWD